MLKPDILTTYICRLSWNLGSSPSWKPQGLSRPHNGIALPFIGYYSCDRLSSSRHRLLNHPDKRHMTLRWQSAGRSGGSAPIGQAENNTLFIVMLVYIFYCMDNHSTYGGITCTHTPPPKKKKIVTVFCLSSGREKCIQVLSWFDHRRTSCS